MLTCKGELGLRERGNGNMEITDDASVFSTEELYKAIDQEVVHLNNKRLCSGLNNFWSRVERAEKAEKDWKHTKKVRNIIQL